MMHFISLARTAALILLCAASFSSANATERISSPLSELIEKYPVQADSDAEVLEKRVFSRVDEKNRRTTTVYVAIRINHENAIDDYSQMNLNYNDYFRDLKLDFAHVLTEDGELSAVRPDAVQLKSESSENFYEDSKSLAFSLPFTYAGSAIEFQYTLTDIRPHIEGEFFIGSSLSHWERRANPQKYRADYVHYAEYLLDAPADLALFYEQAEGFDIKYKKRKKKGRNLHRWSVSDVPAAIVQTYLPEGSSLMPYIEISTVGNWSRIVEWGQSLFEPTIQGDAVTRKVAQSILLKHKDKQAQLEAVFAYMQNNVRYVFAHVGRGGYEPHVSKDVINNGYGDCKDQTVLAITLLRELGIEAYPALVATTGTSSPYDNLPQIAFDHMITYIPQQAGIAETWMDTVGGNFLFPGISSSVNRRKALIISPQTTALTTINSGQNKPNLLTMSLDVQAPAKDTLTAAFTMNFEGEIESSIRSWLRYSDKTENSLYELVGQMYPQATVKNITLSNYDDFAKEISVSGDFVFEHNANNEPLPISFNLNIARFANLFSLLPELENTEKRVHPIAFRSTFSLKTSTTLAKPAGYAVYQSSEKAVKESNPVFAYAHTIDDQQDQVTIDQTLSLLEFVEPAKSYNDIYNHVKKLDDKYWSLTLTYDKQKSKIASLKQKLSKNTGPEEFIQLIETLIDNGEYKSALQQADKAIQQHPKNGGLFYLKGLAHDYLGESSPADQAFQQAETLGYDI